MASLVPEGTTQGSVKRKGPGSQKVEVGMAACQRTKKKSKNSFFFIPPLEQGHACREANTQECSGEAGGLLQGQGWIFTPQDISLKHPGTLVLSTSANLDTIWTLPGGHTDSQQKTRSHLFLLDLRLTKVKTQDSSSCKTEQSFRVLAVRSIQQEGLMNTQGPSEGTDTR